MKCINKCVVIAFVVGGALGVAAGGVAMLVAFPFFFPPPAVNETVDAMTATAVAGEARFREDSRGQDAGHWGRGGVKIYAAEDGGYLLELQPDFEVGPGPNFWLYLNSVGGVEDEDDFLGDANRVKVMKLKSFVGSQVYMISAEAYAGARAVTIWCESFNEYIASADLPAQTG